MKWQIKHQAADEFSCLHGHPVMSPVADTGVHERLQQLVACVFFIV